MKRTRIMAAMAIFTLTASTPVLAAKAGFTSSTKNTAKIGVKSVSYDYDDSDDDIEIDFSNKIKLKSSAKAIVKDSSGKSYKTFIEDHDRNELDLDVSNLAAGKKYTVTVTGIKKSTATKYGTLTITMNIPKASSALVKDVDYDAEDKEVTFDFRSDVTYKNAKVVITNTSGTKTYTAKITDKEHDELSVRVNGLVRGNTYHYKITGVTSKGNGSTTSLNGSFTAVDND